MNRNQFIKCLLFIVLTGAVSTGLPCLAGTDAWTVAGAPFGGTVNTVTVNPTTPATLYAVSGPGIYKTTDSGANWSLVLNLPLNQASDIALEPENPNTLYAATQGSGIYKTTDGGATWISINSGIPMFQGGNNPVSIYRITVDPVNDGVAYAVTLTDGVYKTTDGGQSWNAINTGISQLLFNGSQINRLIVDPVNPQVIYLVDNVFTGPGLPGNTSVAGIYTSTNGGANWSPSLTGIDCWDISVDPENDSDLFVTALLGIYGTTNSGATWKLLPANIPSTYVIRIDPTNSQNLYVGTYFNGVYESKDGGSTWTQPSAEAATYITGFAIDPAPSSDVYVSSINWGMLKSTDGGSTWADANNGIGNVGINEMLMGNDGAIYIGANGEGIYKSTDLGVTWAVMNNGITTSPGLTGITVYALAEDPTTSTTLFAGTVVGLFKTLDGGSDWTLLNNGITDPYTMSLAIDPENTATVYVGTQTKGVFKSVDGGTSWNSMNSGITDTQTSIDILSLAVDPTNSMIVYAGTSSNGLFMSADGGSTWTADDTGMPVTGVWAIAIDPKTPNTMYTSLLNQDIYKSTDGGKTWLSASDGLPEGYIFTAIQIDPQNTSTLYVTGIVQSGVFVSTDGGASWNPLSNGLSSTDRDEDSARSVSTSGAQPRTISEPVVLSTVVINPTQPNKLYAGGSDHNVYTYDVAPLPAASNGSVTTTGGTAVNGTLSGTGSGSLTYAIATQPSHGTVTVTAATGGFTYTPTSGFSGSDNFTFTVSNSVGTSNPATESITVTAAIVAPTANNGSVTTAEGTAVNGTLSATGSGTLTYAVVTQPSYGIVTVTASTGAFTYTPASGFSGSDSFTFTSSDSGGTSNPATEGITVTASSSGSGGSGSSGGSGGGGGLGLLGLLTLVGAVVLRWKIRTH